MQKFILLPEKNSRLYLYCLVIFLLSLLITPLQVGAETSQPSLAPLNPEFVEYREKVKAGIESTGVMPCPVDMSYNMGTGKHFIKMLGGEGLPERFDLRDTGLVTPVRDQGGEGLCWAFAANGSLESNLLRQVPDTAWDLSENHMGHLLSNLYDDGFDRPPDGGGNHSIPTAYLARWNGPVSEEDDPYGSDDSDIISILPVKHVQEVLYLPYRQDALDNNCIKQALMEYGAMYLDYYADISYDDTGYYYYPGGTFEEKNVNHAVTLVGWDDTISKGNFEVKPDGDGAFIIKNSWGSGYGNNGYGYLSYYNPSIGPIAAFISVGDSLNYDQVYQYDPLGWCRSMGFDSNSAYFANVFTALHNEQLQAVSFYTPSAGSSYQISVNLNPQEGSPLGEEPPGYSLSEGTQVYAGYHTVLLDTPVELQAGDKFSIVVKMEASNCSSPVAIEYPEMDYSSKATADAGQSYVSSDGVNWGDLTTDYANSNVCLKAFTNFDGAGLRLATLGKGSFNMSSGSHAFTVNEQVYLQATADEGWYLDKWRINGKDTPVSDPADNTLILSMDTDREVTGFFAATPDYKTVKFYDNNLKKAITDKLGMSSTDDVLVKDMKKLTELYLNNLGIWSFWGLGYATNLEVLEVAESNLYNGDSEWLSKLTSLEELNLENNHISDISFITAFTNLKKLDLSNNEIVDITALAALNSLTWLDISQNQIDVGSDSNSLGIINALLSKGTEVIYAKQYLPYKGSITLNAVADGYQITYTGAASDGLDSYTGRIFAKAGDAPVTEQKIMFTVSSTGDYVSDIIPILDMGDYEMYFYSPQDESRGLFRSSFIIIPMIHVQKPGKISTQQNTKIEGYISNYNASNVWGFTISLNGSQESVWEAIYNATGNFSIPVELLKPDNIYQLTFSSWDCYDVLTGSTEVYNNGTIFFADFSWPVTDGTIEFNSAAGTICTYTGRPADVVMPAAINGVKVTAVGKSAFYDCDSLTSMKIPVSVERIGDGAFEGCSKLSAAYFYGNAPAMGMGVFNNNASDFTAYYLDGKIGFDDLGYPTAIFKDAEIIDECFIATAAYGSKFQPAVALLREFRDKWLLTNYWGHKFVNFYYNNSPPIAQFMAGNEILKFFVRILLVPFVVLAYLFLNPLAGLLAVLVVLLIISCCCKPRPQKC